MVRFCLSIAVISLYTTSAYACGQYDESAPSRVASQNPEVAQAAIQNLRSNGPLGLRNLLSYYHKQLTLPMTEADELAAIERAIDLVAMQKDAKSSGLYWFTDLGKALAKAQELKRPILSLRLLGNLNEELSCANSRFFRTALYANKDISEFLSKNFILHWKSVRPAPKITIDYGDGRKLVRTITGNSIHYVLDQQGRVVDALPGLYSPGAFKKTLTVVHKVALQPRSTVERQAYHQDVAYALFDRCRNDLQSIAADRSPEMASARVIAEQFTDRFPTASEAAPNALAKYRIEQPVLSALVSGLESLEQHSQDALWKAVSELPNHRTNSKLDDHSRALMSNKQPTAEQAERRAAAKSFAEAPLRRQIGMVENFERDMALDTVRNEYLMRPRIHEWLKDSPDMDVEQLNELVYAVLFLTPNSDPWLGLSTPDRYCALPNGGRVASTQ